MKHLRMMPLVVLVPLVACVQSSTTGRNEIEVRTPPAAVTGNAFECTGTWPSDWTPCAYPWSSSPATYARHDSDGIVHLALERSPIPVDGGASTVYIDLDVSAAPVTAIAWEEKTHPGDAAGVETSGPVSGWVQPDVVGVNAGDRTAGAFSLTFSWGSISGTYDAAIH
jgi:hypothetical protein